MISNLTPRERQIFRLLIGGCDRKEIAYRRLRISLRTVDFHIGNLYRKLGMRDAEARIMSILTPLIELPGKTWRLSTRRGRAPRNRSWRADGRPIVSKRR